MNRRIVPSAVGALALAIACGGGTEPEPGPPEPTLAILSIGPSAIRPEQGRVGFGSSLLVDPTGRLHAAWLDVTAGGVVYGTCTAACTTLEGWSRTVVEYIASDPSLFGFDYPSLALGPNGLELAYQTVETGLLRGASCAADCSTTSGWTTFTVALHGGGDRMTSLKVDPTGKRHLAWTDGGGGLRYTQY
jgi:hypothetical protein